MNRAEKARRQDDEQRVLDFLLERALEIQNTDFVRKNKNLSTTVAREKIFLEAFQEKAQQIFKDKLVPSKYALKQHKVPQERILNVILSDLHFHSLLDPREVPHQYGPVEEARRLSAIAVQVAEYKRQYRDATTLYVHLLGDIIQGQLHDPRDGAPLAAQAAAAMRLLSQTVSFFSQNFPKVVVRCTPGNHGRNSARHRDRAINQKWDSIETIIYYGIKLAVATLPNVTVEIPITPHYTYEAFNQRAFFTHGDTVLNPGYPGKTIDVSGVRKQINEINGKLATHQQYQLFAVGHVHVGSVTHLPNGAIFMSNGCLIPPDAYALSIGIFDTACGQWLFESVKDHIVGDHRFITVNELTDRDKALDKVVLPFTNF